MFTFNRSQKEQRRYRLRALAALFQKTDRILSLAPVTCTVLENSDEKVPAWTLGNQITFVDSNVGEVETAEDVVRITGLNYHELGHVIHTPDMRDSHNPLASLIRYEHQASTVFNILEDQRQESLVVARWPSTMHYLTAMFVEYIMNYKEVGAFGQPVKPDHSTTFLLSHGRKYLGSEIRDAIKDLFVDQSLVDSFAEVIDRYRVLNLDVYSDQLMAAHLIRRFIELLGRLPKKQQDQASEYQHAQHCSGGSSGATRPAQSERRVRTQKDEENSKEDLEKVKGGADDRAQIEADKADGGSGSGKTEDGDEPSEGGSSSEGNGEETEPGWREYSEKGGRGIGGNKNRNAKSHGDEKLDEAVKSALDKILRDEEIKSEVSNRQETMRKMDMPEPITEKVTYRQFSNPDIAGVARRIGRKLQQIVEAQDPGWDRRQSSGRLNIHRAMSDRNIDELFDQWNEGNNDAASVEAVVLLDTSSSMAGKSQELSEAAWAIKKSFDTILAPCTIYEFNDSEKVVYEATSRVESGKAPNILIRGGTRPALALTEAARRLLDSKRKRKIFIVLTDGEWQVSVADSYRPDDIIADMNKGGVVTALAYLPTGYQAQNGIREENVTRHNCTIVRLISNLPDLVDMTSQITRTVLSMRR